MGQTENGERGVRGFPENSDAVIALDRSCAMLSRGLWGAIWPASRESGSESVQSAQVVGLSLLSSRSCALHTPLLRPVTARDSC